MKAELVQLTNKGMRQDESISKSSNEFAFENNNIRIVAIDENTTAIATSEKLPNKVLYIYPEINSNPKIYNTISFASPQQATTYVKSIDVSSLFNVDVLSGINIYSTITFHDTTPVNPEPDKVMRFTVHLLYGSNNTSITVYNSPSNWEVTSIEATITPYTSDNYIYIQEGSEISHPILENLVGEYIGHCSSSEYCTVFTKELTNDGFTNRIYRLRYDVSDDKVYYRLLYQGDLGITNRVETLFYYESEDVQKVYWVDGEHVTRVINIMSQITYDPSNTVQFDFNPNITSLPTLTVTKSYDYAGLFAQGTIQYFVTYYKKFGAETGVVQMSSLNYLSYINRGAAADENVFCGFKIEIGNIDHNFDYARIYSAQRTSEDGPVTLKVVTELEIKDGVDTLTYVDLGTQGEIIDSNFLYYIGGQSIIASTLEQKDGHLFLGDIKLAETAVDDELKEAIDGLRGNDNEALRVSFAYKEIPTPTYDGYYAHVQEINDSQKDIATFKRGELYRFAIQFMLPTGEWTQPYWVGDKECDKAPIYENNVNKVATATFDMQSSGLSSLIEGKYIGYRLLYAETNNFTRRILAQGIVNPTLFNYEERANNEPYCLPSWNFRLRGSDSPWRHLQNIGSQYRDYAELQGVTKEMLPMYNVELTGALEHFRYYNLYLCLDAGHEMTALLIYYSVPEDDNYANSFINRLNDSVSTNVFEDYGSVSDPHNWNSTAYYVAEKVHVNTGNWKDTIDGIWDGLVTAGNNLYYKITGSNPPYLDKVYLPFSKNQLFNSKTCKSIINRRIGAPFWGALAAVVATALGIVLSVISFGSASLPAAGAIAAILGAIAGIGSTATMITTIVAISMVGATVIIDQLGRSADLDKLARKMVSLGWVEASDDIDDIYNKLKEKYENLTDFRDFHGGTIWASGGQNILFSEVKDADIQSKGNQYYIDNSIITLHSPELDNTQDIIDNNTSLKFRIIGVAPVYSMKSDYTFLTDIGYRKDSRTILSNNDYDYPYISYSIDNFANGWLYLDAILGSVPSTTIDGENDVNELGYYKIFLWNRKYASLAGLNTNKILSYDKNLFGEIKRKVFATQKYSPNTVYFKDEENDSEYWESEYGITVPRVYYNDKNPLAINNQYTDYKLYNASYDTLIPAPTEYPLLVEGTNGKNYTENGINVSPYPYYQYGNSDLCTTNPVRIKLDSTPHVVFELGSGEHYGIKEILPRLINEPKLGMDFYTSSNTVEGWNISYSYFTPWGSINDLHTYSIVDVDSNNKGCGEYKLLTYNDRWEAFNLELDNAAFNLDGTLNQGYLREALGISSDDWTTVYRFILEYLHNNPIVCYVGTKDSYYKIYNDNYVSLPSPGDFKYEQITDSTFEESYHLFRVVEVDTDNLAYTVGKQVILEASSRKLFPIFGGVPYSEDTLQLSETFDGSYVYVGELYRDFGNVDPYGGTEPYQLQQLKWNVCSDITNVSDNIEITYGDTFYQRWDCLKSYPSTEEDENSIVDILSFMVETHTNVDGRYDSLRGTHSILYARPNTWNLMNPSYSQENNLIQYNILDEKFDLSKFKNWVVMSLAKSDTANVDTWTNITTLASLSLDGKYGAVNKLLNWKDNLLFFQDKAVGRINFNERTQISTEQGIPIEVANSGKLNGYSYIDNNSGALCKWGIGSTSSGVYYVDSLNKAFKTIGENGAIDLGVKAGMSVWFNNNTTLEPRIDIDNITNDVYINPGTGPSLSFNEKLGNFSSFYSAYAGYISTNLKSKSLGLSVNDSLTNTPVTRVYFMRDGSTYYPYDVTYRINPEPHIDKIFTNIEYIADVHSERIDSISSKSYQENLSAAEPFDTLEVWNEYQKGTTNLTTLPNFYYPDLRRKFRIRRADIPRDTKHIFDRIRNPWCMVKLSQKTSLGGLMTFHSLLVKYYK